MQSVIYSFRFIIRWNEISENIYYHVYNIQINELANKLLIT